MPIPIEKALLIKLFYTNNEAALKALRKFKILKKMKERSGPVTENGLRCLVKRFEDTGCL